MEKYWKKKKNLHFSVENKSVLSQAILLNFFIFIDHKSKMAQTDSFVCHFFPSLPIKIKKWDKFKKKKKQQKKKKKTE